MKKGVIALLVALMFVSTCSDVFAADKAERGGGGNECYQYVKNIQQPDTYNCGTTTVLQTLYGLGFASEVPGATDEEKIQYLDDEYNVDTQEFTYVGDIPKAINRFSAIEHEYKAVICTNMTMATFEQIVATSLTNCNPVILHAKTEYLSYYGGKECSHYINLDYINRTTDQVRLVDCHYNDAYYGVHYVPLEEAYDAIHAVSGRWMIY